MKQLTIFLITTILASSVFAEETNWSKNLLLNPGAETGKLIEREWKVSTGTVTIHSNYKNAFPTKGNYLFRFVDTSAMSQNIDISSYANSIDNGNIEIKVGGFLKEYSYGNFACFFRTQYYDEKSSYLNEDLQTIDCNDQRSWVEQSMIKTLPPGTRSVNFQIRTVNYVGSSDNILVDELYFYISADSSTDTPTNDNKPSQTCTSAKGTTSNLKFTGVKSSYNVGDTVNISLQEDMQFFSRTENVDLWVIIQLPTENLLFMTEDVFNPFTSRQQRFKSAVETNETTHKILEFKVRRGLAGKYIFSALYVQQGKNPMEGFLWQRSNVAIANIVLNN
jgi:hypothetical protein